jgi:hypothetical protein
VGWFFQNYLKCFLWILVLDVLSAQNSFVPDIYMASFPISFWLLLKVISGKSSLSKYTQPQNKYISPLSLL